MSEIPIPIFNYVHLIQEQKSPYYDIARYLVEVMEKRFSKKSYANELVCHINPRILRRKMEKEIKHEKLTTINVCRTILALFYVNDLKEGEDYYVTTSGGGRKNYHVKLNPNVLFSFKTMTSF